MCWGPALVYQKSYATLGDVAADMNYNNLHVYFGGRNPGSAGWGSGDAEGHSYGSIAWWLDNAQADAPDVPSVVTETGYLANPEGDAVHAAAEYRSEVCAADDARDVQRGRAQELLLRTGGRR